MHLARDGKQNKHGEKQDAEYFREGAGDVPLHKHQRVVLDWYAHAHASHKLRVESGSRASRPSAGICSRAAR